jgi:hypothetical protein
VLTIPDHAQGAAIGGGGLWIARSDWSWGTLDRLDPATGAPQRRYEIAPGTEGIAFGSAGRLWAVSEAGSRHIYDHPFSVCSNPFFRWSSRSTSLAWSNRPGHPKASAPKPGGASSQWTLRWRKTDSNLWSHFQRGQRFRARHSVSRSTAPATSVLISENDDFEFPAAKVTSLAKARASC